MTDDSSSGREVSTAGRARITQDVIGGLVLSMAGAFFAWQAWDLPLGSPGAMGPGMLPMSVAVLIAIGGAVLATTGLVAGGEVMTMPHLRGMFFIIGGIVLFGLTIRSLGLVVAGPVSMIFASAATDEMRPLETSVFAVCITVFCILLFKYALGLPIPVVAFM